MMRHPILAALCTLLALWLLAMYLGAMRASGQIVAARKLSFDSSLACAQSVDRAYHLGLQILEMDRRTGGCSLVVSGDLAVVKAFDELVPTPGTKE